MLERKPNSLIGARFPRTVSNPMSARHDSHSVAMETSKPGTANTVLHINSAEEKMDVQAPLTALYIHTLPAVLAHPGSQPPTALRLPGEPLPSFTFHFPKGLQLLAGVSAAATGSSSTRGTLKSSGKHVCPHCGRDCMKPSVLEKHLRCHTGERPYPCSTCKVSFKTQSNLYKHRRTQAHARLSYESERSSQGSLDSSSRDTSFSSLSLDEPADESTATEKAPTVDATEAKDGRRAAEAVPAETQGSAFSPEKALELKECRAVTAVVDRSEEKPLNVIQHPSLQRQEARLFSKHWDSSLSRGKSQSHESTDSGFSESCDPSLSPVPVLSDRGVESIAESCSKLLETGTVGPPESSMDGRLPKDTMRQGEQRMLAERISRLISQNTAVVEDKHLEHVRPRKTVLSKQGSIDLPMPYTYKDSFHFEMRLSPNDVGQANVRAGTPRSTTPNRVPPMTRSHSLPFSVTLLQPERRTSSPSCHTDHFTFLQRESSGQVNPTGSPPKPVTQSSSNPRPLVRQTAIDGNPPTEDPFSNQSVEEACIIGSLGSDGDSGDISEETTVKKLHRRKSQKFAYDKWYVYGGGTFRKLYSIDKSVENCGIKPKKSSTSTEPEALHGDNLSPKAVVDFAGTSGASRSISTGGSDQQVSNVKAPLQRIPCLSVLSLPSIGSIMSHKIEPETQIGGVDTSQLSEVQVPSHRKKPKTDFQKVTLEEAKIVSLLPSSGIATKTPQGSDVAPRNVPTQNQTDASAQPVTEPLSVTNGNFLPKYQLKIPNTADKASSSSASDAGHKTDSDTLRLSSHPEDNLGLQSNISNVTQTVNTPKCLDVPATVPTLRQSLASHLSVNRPAHSKTHFNTLRASGHAADPGVPLAPGSVAVDQVPPGAQSVFHVQTADLQICLQIISDEQLALMEPQIEHQPLAPPHVQRQDVEEERQEVVPSTAEEASVSSRDATPKEGKGCSVTTEERNQGQEITLDLMVDSGRDSKQDKAQLKVEGAPGDASPRVSGQCSAACVQQREPSASPLSCTDPTQPITCSTEAMTSSHVLVECVSPDVRATPTCRSQSDDSGGDDDDDEGKLIIEL